MTKRYQGRVGNKFQCHDVYCLIQIKAYYLLDGLTPTSVTDFTKYTFIIMQRFNKHVINEEKEERLRPSDKRIYLLPVSWTK